MTTKAEKLVSGDLIMLNVGDIVPADVRLVSGLNLSTDEALLTGESVPVSKHSDIVLANADIPLGDRVNMVYSASTITCGRGIGIVTATGMNTEVGRIAELLRSTSSPKSENAHWFISYWQRVKMGTRSILGLDGTPLQVKLSKFALLLFGFAILLAIIVFSANRFDIDSDVLIYGICVGVAVIPESLIAVLTISMAVGTKAMAKGNVIVRKLSVLEAVGGVTNICSDKTGTLTQGKMITRKIWLQNGSVALVEACTHPLDPASGNVIWKYDKSSVWGPQSAIPGLPLSAKTFIECISLCNNASVSDAKAALGDDMAETAGAVHKCKIAGISVHMLTGDHIKTATSIAHEVGILGPNLTTAEAANATMPASAFDALSDAQIDALDRLPLVLARCSPSTKVRMVEALHRRGAYCVMTGDGVNDSPALKKADVGIAMGLNGSDVAKEAADMVLTDDNFASIVTAVEEGRRLFDNIQKVRSALIFIPFNSYTAESYLC